MKKFWIILIISTILVLGVLVIVASFTSKQNFVQKSYSSNEKEISALVIDVEDREVEINISTDKQVHIDYHESEKEYYSITVSENGELNISLVYNKNWLDYFGIKPNKDYRKISLQVPDNLLDKIEISTTNEAIKLNNISVKQSVALNSNGGNVEFENLFVGEQIKLNAKNSNITGTIKGTYNDFSIFCKIKKGSCNLPTNKEGGTKSLFADCNNGNIKIDFVE